MEKSKNKIFSKILNGRKTKSYTVLFRVITAYSHNDYEKFSFEGWICLIINKKPVFFKRIRDKTLHWHIFGWENIFKKNWKYIGPSKENYIYSWPIDTWYIINYDFINKIITVKEQITKND